MTSDMVEVAQRTQLKVDRHGNSPEGPSIPWTTITITIEIARSLQTIKEMVLVVEGGAVVKPRQHIKY